MSRRVIITGCSDGGLGAALAIELHRAGYHVLATARNLSKLSSVKDAGIETLLQLDVQSSTSIAACVAEVRKHGGIDMLVNNAGGIYQAPLADASVSEMKQLFDLNVFSLVSVTQAFLPLLLKSDDPVIVNHTSIASMLGLPFNAVYSASKAAAANLTAALRLELRPFGVKVVEIKSGNVRSNINNNANAIREPEVASTSIFYPARELIRAILSGERYKSQEVPADEWARTVVAKLSGKGTALPLSIWTGGEASMVWWCLALLPTKVLEDIVASGQKINEIKKAILDYGREKAIENAYGKLK